MFQAVKRPVEIVKRWLNFKAIFLGFLTLSCHAACIIKFLLKPGDLDFINNGTKKEISLVKMN